MPDQDLFIRASPDIIRDKSLSDTAWLCYCRLEQIAKSSRTVHRYATRLGYPEATVIMALAELSTGHPTCYHIDGHKLILGKPPTKFTRVPFQVIDDTNLPTWQKRVVVAVLDQAYETTINRGVGQINMSKLLVRCRLPAREKGDRKLLIWGTIDLMVQRGVIEILSQRPGTTTTCRLNKSAAWGADWGADTTENAARTPGSATAAPQVEGSSHPRFDAAAPHPSGQKPRKETKERNPPTRNHDEPTQAPTVEESSMNRGSDPDPLDEPNPGPRTPTIWERIELASPCKSTDSPAELAELWRDRRPCILACYESAGIPWDAETVVADLLAVQAKYFNDRLPLAAMLAARWDRTHQALERWLANGPARVELHALCLVRALSPDGAPLDLAAVTDETLKTTWDKITGYSVPCPPCVLIRRVLA